MSVGSVVHDDAPDPALRAFKEREALIMAILDEAGVAAAPPVADDKTTPTPYTLVERVRVAIMDRDRAIDAERLIRDSHKATTTRAADLQRSIDTIESRIGFALAALNKP